MNFKLNEITKKVYHLHFHRQIDLTTTFVRFSEYCESPRFRGKIFNLDEFKSWYKTTTKKHRFTYFTDVSGFNIPSKALKPFYKGLFDPLTRKEKMLLSLFKDVRGKFCIIGTYSERGSNMHDTLQHEISHGLFYTNPEYRAEVKKLLKNKKLAEIKSFLGKQGYSKAVWEDEIHAFIMCDTSFMRSRGVKITIEIIKLRKELNKIFKKYYKEKI